VVKECPAAALQRPPGTGRFLFGSIRKEELMLKASTIAVCVLALSGATAQAQSYAPWMPTGPTTAPGGATDQSNKAQGAAQAYVPAAITARGTENPRNVAITDEYGVEYNSRGDRIGRAPAMR
jgi:hypothetical protein